MDAVSVLIFLLLLPEPDIPDVELPEMVPYYDLSDLPGTKELSREKDANSDPINIPRGMLFGDRIMTQAYVRAALGIHACT